MKASPMDFDLKACPFCGSPAKAVGQNGKYVECSNGDDACSAPCALADDSFYMDRDTWNRRAVSSEREKLEAVAREVRKILYTENGVWRVGVHGDSPVVSLGAALTALEAGKEVPRG